MVVGVDHITISVSDIERSYAFYTGTLGLRPVARWSTGAYLLAGPAWIALVEESGVAITAAVWERIKGRYSTRRLPDMTVKWRPEPLVAWEIIEARARPGARP